MQRWILLDCSTVVGPPVLAEVGEDPSETEHSPTAPQSQTSVASPSGASSKAQLADSEGDDAAAEGEEKVASSKGEP